VGNAAHTISGVGVAAPTRSLDLDEGIATLISVICQLVFGALAILVQFVMCCVVCSPRFCGTKTNFKPTIRFESCLDSDLRRHRHSIPGHLNVLMTQRQSVVAKRKLSQHQHQHPALFSTAVISGSSSAPELTAILPSTGTAMGLGLANLAAIDPCVSVGVPAIRPLETLHNGYYR
jgi:inositol hexakisphosphate/diphosphoinositol-pentakisphosphate kinase